MRLSYRNILLFKILSIWIISFFSLHSFELILALIYLILIKAIVSWRIITIFCLICFWYILIYTIIILSLWLIIVSRLLIRFCVLIIIWLKIWYTIYIEVLLIIKSLHLLSIIVLMWWRIIHYSIRICTMIIIIHTHTSILTRKVIKLVLICIWILGRIVILLKLRPLILRDWLLCTWYKTICVLI